MFRKNKQYFIFFIFVLILIAYHFFAYIGHYGYDDLHYAKLANDFKHGLVNYDDHYSFRTPVIALTSLSYAVFGISDFSSSLPAMLISVSVLFFVFLLLKDKGNKHLIIGLSLTGLSNFFLLYSDKLMPDMYVVLSVIAVLFFFHRYRYKNKTEKEWLYALLIALALLFGFMSKGTIVLLLPLLAYFFFVDVFQKKHIKFWVYTVAINLVVFAAYFLVIWLLTGDVLQRFHAITQNSYLNLCSYSEQPKIILLKRIVYEFFLLMINSGMAAGFIFVLAYMLQKKSLNVLKMENEFSFWITSSLILLLSSNFMSISFTAYSPMCLDPRHYLFLIPVVAVPASSVVVEFLEKKSLKIPILVFSLLITVCAFFFQKGSFWGLYLPLSLLILSHIVWKKNDFLQKTFVFLFMIIALIKPLRMVKYAHEVQYNKQKEIYLEQVQKSMTNSVIITNDVQKRLANYYAGFEQNLSNEIIDFRDFVYDSTDNRKKILFLNWYTQYLSGMNEDDLPYFARNISSGNKLLYEYKPLNIAIYEMNNFLIPDKNGKLLLNSINDFENPADCWNYNTESISNDVAFEGKHSNQLAEYSLTFEYDLDSLELINFDLVLIKSTSYCNFYDKTDAKLVVSLETDEGAYVWKAVEINKDIVAYSNWCKTKYEISFEKHEIKAHSKLKVYIWNQNKQKAYVDNFQVQIIGF